MYQLSVIIPTYKRTESLFVLLEKLTEQNGINIEVIIVDQNAEGYLDKNILAKFKVAKHILLTIPNASAARNIGYLQSIAPYVLFVDDDLIPENNFCKSGVDFFANHPEIKCFIPLVYNDQGKQLTINGAIQFSIGKHEKNKNILLLSDAKSAAIFFEREYYKATGGFDPHIFEFARTAEDQEFFLRMKARKQQLWFVPNIEVYHNEGIPGGCDLRTEEYWNTRERCVKSWALRYRIHSPNSGKIRITDLLALARSSFLNLSLFSSGLKNLQKQIKTLQKGLKSSKAFFLSKQDIYNKKVIEINHI